MLGNRPEDCRGIEFFAPSWIVLTVGLCLSLKLEQKVIEKEKIPSTENAQKRKQIIMSVDSLLLKSREGRGAQCVSHLVENLDFDSSRRVKARNREHTKKD